MNTLAPPTPLEELAKGSSLEDAARRFQEELEGILRPKGWYRGEKLKI